MGGGSPVIATTRRLLDLAPPPWARLALSVALGSAAVVCGVGLMATAGYLIARAAERPEVLSLTVAIVAVRFFGLGRPLARYLERLSSHDVAFRLLARVRVRFYDRIEPLAPAGSTRIARATCSAGWSATSMPSRASICAAWARRPSPCWSGPSPLASRQRSCRSQP